MTEILRILRERKDAPLTEPRAYDQQFAGTCQVRRLCADPRLAVPREIFSSAPFHGLRKITLPPPLPSSPPA